MGACDAKVKATGGTEGPDVKDVIACVRGHGLDAPTDPDAFKRWLTGSGDASAVDAALRDCKVSLAPRSSEGSVKPGACGGDVGPADEGAKPGAPKQGAAQAGI
jgi:hypothetical protein